MPKVSVIVPIYKVEKYIEHCAKSLFEQSLDDIEYIFVNDCTPDRSVELLLRTAEAYPGRTNRISVIHLECNSGLAAVRAIGMKAATGEYVIHCDSDDWVDPGLYETMYLAAKDNDADIVMYDVMNEYSGQSIPKIYACHTNLARQAIKDMYRNYFDMYTVNKLVRRSIYTKYAIYPYEGINMWEDNGLMYRIFYHAGRLVSVHDVYYHYNRCNENALTHNYKRSSVEQMIRCATALEEFFLCKEDGVAYASTVDMLKFCAKINLITDHYSGIREYRHVFPGSERCLKKLDRRAFSRKGRFRLFFVEHHLAWLFVSLFKVRNFIIGFVCLK